MVLARDAVLLAVTLGRLGSGEASEPALRLRVFLDDVVFVGAGVSVNDELDW